MFSFTNVFASVSNTSGNRGSVGGSSKSQAAAGSSGKELDAQTTELMIKVLGGLITVFGMYLGSRAAQRGAKSKIDLNDPRINLIEKAKNGRLPLAAGRKDLILNMEEILFQKETANVLLVGPAGTGKTAIVESLAQKIASGDVPDALKGIKILAISTATFTAGACFIGQFEERVETLIKEAETDGKIVIFVDETHSLIEKTPTSRPNLVDALKPALGRGLLRMIGCTTDAEVAQIMQDPAFARRFSILSVPEPRGSDLRAILEVKVKDLEKHHGCTYDPGTIETVLSQSRELSGNAPAKQVRILDRLGARAVLQKVTLPDSSATVAPHVTSRDVTALIEEQRKDAQNLNRAPLFMYS